MHDQKRFQRSSKEWSHPGGVYDERRKRAVQRLLGADFSFHTGSTFSNVVSFDVDNRAYDGSDNLISLRRYDSSSLQAS